MLEQRLRASIRLNHAARYRDERSGHGYPALAVRSQISEAAGFVAMTAPVGACVEPGIHATTFDDLDNEACDVGASEHLLITRRREHARLESAIGISRRGPFAIICRPFCRCLRSDAASAAVVI